VGQPAADKTHLRLILVPRCSILDRGVELGARRLARAAVSSVASPEEATTNRVLSDVEIAGTTFNHERQQITHV
jgi:hypothetical protein